MSQHAESALFRTGQDPRFNAWLPWLDTQHELYADGYRQAAERLFDSIVERPTELSALVFPTVFLYRHWLELRLKLIIHEGRQLLEAGKGYPEHHKVHLLWPTAKGLIKRVWPGQPPEFKLIESVVADFERFDEGSTTFRYPAAKGGENALEGLAQIDIRHFVETMNKIADFLDGASCGISAYLSDLRSSA